MTTWRHDVVCRPRKTMKKQQTKRLNLLWHLGTQIPRDRVTPRASRRRMIFFLSPPPSSNPSIRCLRSSPRTAEGNDVVQNELGCPATRQPVFDRNLGSWCHIDFVKEIAPAPSNRSRIHRPVTSAYNLPPIGSGARLSQPQT